jgi:hypothetical protein
MAQADHSCAIVALVGTPERIMLARAVADSCLSGALESSALAEISAVVDGVAAEPALRSALERAWRNLTQQALPNQARRTAIPDQQAHIARRRLADEATLLVDGTLDRTGYEVLRDQQLEILKACETEWPGCGPFSHLDSAWSGDQSGR